MCKCKIYCGTEVDPQTMPDNRIKVFVYSSHMTNLHNDYSAFMYDWRIADVLLCVFWRLNMHTCQLAHIWGIFTHFWPEQ